MKKMFLALMTSLALSTYSYAAYDDEDEMDEEDSPAAVEEDEDEADDEEEEVKPAKKEKKAEKKASKKSGDPTIGFGVGFVNHDLSNFESRFNAAFKLNPSMELSAILGLYHHGATTVKNQDGSEATGEDNYTALSIGVGFDYYIAQPVSIGGQLIYDSIGEDDSAIEFNVIFGLHGEIVKNVVLSGNIGLDILYMMGKDNGNDTSRLDFGFAPGIKCTWYVF